MNKTETFKVILEKLLEVEMTSSKCLFLYYHGNIDSLDFHFTPNKKNTREKIGRNFSIYLDGPLKTLENEIQQIFKDIDAIKKVEDGPIEEILTFQIPESKAREIGLLT